MENDNDEINVICKKVKKVWAKIINNFAKFVKKDKDVQTQVLSTVETSIQNEISKNERMPLQNAEASFKSEFQKSIQQSIIVTNRKDDKYGSIAVALLCLSTRTVGLLLCIIYFTSAKVYPETNSKKIQQTVIELILLMCIGECGIEIFVSLFLICGILMKKKLLLLPWLIWTFLETFCCLIAIVPLMILAVKGWPWYPVVIWVCFVVPLISLHRSCASFVASHYCSLSERRNRSLNDIIIGKYGTLVLTDT